MKAVHHHLRHFKPIRAAFFLQTHSFWARSHFFVVVAAAHLHLCQCSSSSSSTCTWGLFIKNGSVALCFDSHLTHQADLCGPLFLIQLKLHEWDEGSLNLNKYKVFKSPALSFNHLGKLFFNQNGTHNQHNYGRLSMCSASGKHPDPVLKLMPTTLTPGHGLSRRSSESILSGFPKGQFHLPVFFHQDAYTHLFLAQELWPQTTKDLKVAITLTE